MIADWPRFAVLVPVALFAMAMLIMTLRRYLKAGVVPYQRTYSGAPVTRRETPIFFWIHIGMLVVLIAGSAWLAVHITGYVFGLWGWSIEL